MAEFPKSAESRINGKPPLPYGSRSVKPVKWGKLKTLNVVSDTDSSRYVKEWWVWKLIEKGTSQTHIDRLNYGVWSFLVKC